TVDGQTYQINPSQRADYDALLTDLLNRGQHPQQIVDLRGLGESGANVSALLLLAQSLEQHPLSEKGTITLVTNGVHEVSESDDLHPAKAALLGMATVISQENTSLVCQNIDVVWPQNADKLAGQLFAALTANANDAVVAYRGSQRWVQTYEPVRIEKPDA